MEILIASQNPGKFLEIQEILKPLGARLFSPKDLGIDRDYEEIGESFEENALGKARFYAGLSGLLTVADDSGLFVEALAGELGVKTRRWGAGEHASDEEWLRFFMQRMAEESNRSAKFVSAAALVGLQEEKIFLGETRGWISPQIEAPLKPGIPLSSVFRPEGYDKVYSALTESEKNALSHRGKAFSQLLEHLNHVKNHSATH